MIDHNHFICHFIFGGHLLNIPISKFIQFLYLETAHFFESDVFIFALF